MKSLGHNTEETEEDLYDFGTVIDWLKAGKLYTRMWWNGDHFICLQKKTVNSKMTESYIYIHTESQQLIPWTISQTDALAMDWLEVTD